MFNDQLDDTPIRDGIASFAGGMRSDAPAKRLADDESELLMNVDVETNGAATTRRGTLRLGAGYVEDGSEFAGGRWIQGMHSYNVPNGNRLVAVNKGALWSYDGLVWTRLPGYLAGSMPFHTQMPVCIVQGSNDLYLSDVFRSIARYDGTTFTSLGSGGASQPPFGCACIVWHTERLVAAASSTSKYVIAFSDILDATTWDTTTQQITVGKGDGDPVTGVFSWIEFNLIVFKRQSIHIVHCNPTLAVADFPIKPITYEFGVTAWRTAAQVGTDVFVLTNSGVRSIRRTIAVENQQDVGPSISDPVADLIRRINPAYVTYCHAIAWKHRYILFLPLDDSTFPNYALVYNTRLNSWSGYWTGLNVTVAATRVAADGSTRLVFGDSNGRVKEWRDYDQTETLASYQDEGGANIPTLIFTRALTFGDDEAPKSGMNYEVEYSAKSFGGAAPTITTINENATTSETQTLDTLNGSTRRQAFDLQARGPFRELQFRLISQAGKVTLKRATARAFVDSPVIQT